MTTEETNRLVDYAEDSRGDFIRPKERSAIPWGSILTWVCLIALVYFGARMLPHIRQHFLYPKSHVEIGDLNLEVNDTLCTRISEHSDFAVYARWRTTYWEANCVQVQSVAR